MLPAERACHRARAEHGAAADRGPRRRAAPSSRAARSRAHGSAADLRPGSQRRWRAHLGRAAIADPRSAGLHPPAPEAARGHAAMPPLDCPLPTPDVLDRRARGRPLRRIRLCDGLSAGRRGRRGRLPPAVRSRSRASGAAARVGRRPARRQQRAVGEFSARRVDRGPARGSSTASRAGSRRASGTSGRGWTTSCSWRRCCSPPAR